MKVPEIEFIPLRDAVRSDNTTILDVLVKIIPPEPEANIQRPALNLGLVIDRSGSMQGKKILYARQAACYAVEQLLPTDRISVTIYDDQVEILVASTLAKDKVEITRQIERIQARNTTALHAGWVEGGVQVSHYFDPEQLNRVILLSDGLANRGETNPDVIASDVKGLAERGVSTTTMGVGDDYNEDLLEAMANSGDGNYYYIESSEQLPEIFQMELQGLMATLGRNVTLGIEPQGEVVLVDVFNDLELTHQGLFKLPNLVLGNPFVVVVRLKVPAIEGKQQADLCHFHLAWDGNEQEERLKLEAMLQLPVLASAELEKFPFNPEVQRQVALMMSARAKQEAVQQVDRGEYEIASQLINDTRQQLLRAPQSPLIEQEAQSLVDLDTDLKARRLQQYRKRSQYESHQYQRSMRQSIQGDYYTKRSDRQFFRQNYSNQEQKRFLRSRIEVVQGDITQQQVDGIVNPTNQNLSGTSGVTGAIRHAAGPQLQEACRRLHSCGIGEAKLTDGYNLPSKWIIHTVGPIWQGGHQGEEQMLAQCYRSCLTLAEQQSMRTVAFPGISTGARGFPIDKAAKIAVREVVNFLASNSSIKKVIFVCYKNTDYYYYQDALQ
ncbi:MAG: VWA domain-containing protein [Symploca sp. SIO2E6]|nr:VWA domain-containing protein [Symploca sp. SIO2E6]